ncbi:elongation factor Tu, mitochondrial [Tanacetum coccineum]|uniref:Elongation factor Tu, mitochondrial n=1 Tax=Tanacetum coccineum TaxID=301880 RepID=A0ABQ5BHW9_9ASTR
MVKNLMGCLDRHAYAFRCLSLEDLCSAATSPNGLHLQQLIYNGKKMRNAETLSAFGLTDGDLVMMVLADEEKAKAIAFDEINKTPEENKRGLTIATPHVAKKIVRKLDVLHGHATNLSACKTAVVIRRCWPVVCRLEEGKVDDYMHELMMWLEKPTRLAQLATKGNLEEVSLERSQVRVST